MEAESVVPSTRLEREAIDAGSRWVAGVDEVGRGALGGPVVAAAVVLPTDLQYALRCLTSVRDSKALTAAQRVVLAEDIRRCARAVGVGHALPREIDALGIRVATEIAVARALVELPRRVDLALVDGYEMPTLRVPQRAIVKGDRSVLSIAAASIVAKVSRDAMMIRVSGPALAYGWHKNKGYGAPVHLRALATLGPTTEHRLSWSPIGWLGGSGTSGGTSQLALPGLTWDALGEPQHVRGDEVDGEENDRRRDWWDGSNPAGAVWRVQRALDAAPVVS